MATTSRNWCPAYSKTREPSKFAGDIKASGGSTIVIDTAPGQANGVFDIKCDAVIEAAGVVGDLTVDNGAVLKKTGGTGMTDIQMNVLPRNGGKVTPTNKQLKTKNLDNVSGIIEVNGGTLIVVGAFQQSGGTATLNDGGHINVLGHFDYTGGLFGMTDAILATTEGFNIGSGVAFSGTGTIEGDVVAAGAWTLGDSYESPVTLAITGNVTLDSNTLYVHSGQLGVGGDFTHNATILYLAGGALIEIDGDFQQTGGVTMLHGPSNYQATFTVGGSLTLSGGTFTLGMSAWMAVEGAVTLSGGLLTLETGEAHLSAGSGLSIGVNGQVAGVGTIVGNVTNAGILRSSLWPVAGLLSIQGNYTQSSTGTLHATIDEFGGGDQFQVSGQATLDGTFVLTLQPNGSPYSGPYAVLSSSSRSGTFASLSLPDLGSGYFWDWSYASGLSLRVEFEI